MDIGGLYLKLRQIVVEFLGHAFREGGYEHSFVTLNAVVDFAQEVVNLMERRTHFNYRVEQTRRTDNLFHYHPSAFLQLIVGRGRADVEHLWCQFFEFFEFQRAVVECGGETEAVFHKIQLA